MSKRKNSGEAYTVGLKEDEEEEGEQDDVLELNISNPRKRIRRCSDVIDSLGDREDGVFGHHSTPRRQNNSVNTESPDTGFSVSPESLNVFVQQESPIVVKKTSTTTSDAGPFSQEEQLLSQQSRASSGLIARMVQEKEEPGYNMQHKNRGKCVIFNHDEFDIGYQERTGSKKDVHRLQKTFEKLNFDVQIHHNLRLAKIEEQIEKLSRDNHRDSDCICIIVLSHGEANNHLCARDTIYSIEKIWKPFTGDRCPSLAGKPKLFFFQACRGNQMDHGIQLQRMTASSGSNSSRTETDSGPATYRLPTHADFLIAHSTVDGFYSWRNPEHGTWYIQCLCKVLNEYHDSTDLLDMLTICAREVATECTSFNEFDLMSSNKKQVPSIISMLIRKVYFPPK